MARFFPRHANAIARSMILGLPVIVMAIGGVVWEVTNSPYVTAQDVVIDQPIPFSHEHHVNGLGVDCRFCHTAVDKSAFPGIPPTKTCMTCHSQIWTNAPMLQPVRTSWSTDKPIQWNKVHAIPDYVYFNHQAHVNKGVGCASCHGRVDQMPLMRQASTLQMAWCLDCHRHPEKVLRPRDQVYSMTYQQPADQTDLGNQLAAQYHVRSPQELTDCTTCHR